MPDLVVTGRRVLADPWTAVEPPVVLIGGSGRVVAVGKKALAWASTGAIREDFPGGVITPSLIDCHVHVSFAADGSPGEATIDVSDTDLLNRAMSNVRRALAAGVTTIADQGGRRAITLEARVACRARAGTCPDLRVAGCPITVPRGHMWYFGGEANDAEGVQRLALYLINQGVDLLKVVTTGGGTAGSDEFSATFATDALRAAVAVAHEAGLPVASHASCIDGIRRSTEAGCDLIHHCNFYRQDGIRAFDSQLAEEMAAQQLVVDPTLWVTESRMLHFQELIHAGNTPARQEMQIMEERWAGKRTDVEGLIRAGVRLVAGSDAGWQYARFGETWREVIALANFGLTQMEALAAGTVYAADVLRIGHDTGSLWPGRWGDMLILAGDPTENLRHLESPRAVFRRGIRVPI